VPLPHSVQLQQLLQQRLEQIQQSFAFDKRISNLEAEKTRSA